MREDKEGMHKVREHNRKVKGQRGGGGKVTVCVYVSVCVGSRDRHLASTPVLEGKRRVERALNGWRGEERVEGERRVNVERKEQQESEGWN
ncbi:hypothetical protein E2C01_065995 [Portunus trituberculatus]|uniref:Uncharacterized protein n=1 Tax=Portunus trituberculatus TaxID=210409 RepID=A0A5B7HPT7_PORTR|nr:hypothetical protein [Portunus trituberculatus]